MALNASKQWAFDWILMFQATAILTVHHFAKYTFFYSVGCERFVFTLGKKYF